MQNLVRHERSLDFVQSEATDELVAGECHIQITFLVYYHDYWAGNYCSRLKKLLGKFLVVVHMRAVVALFGCWLR